MLVSASSPSSSRPALVPLPRPPLPRPASLVPADFQWLLCLLLGPLSFVPPGSQPLFFGLAGRGVCSSLAWHCLWVGSIACIGVLSLVLPAGPRSPASSLGVAFLWILLSSWSPSLPLATLAALCPPWPLSFVPTRVLCPLLSRVRPPLYRGSVFGSWCIRSPLPRLSYSRLLPWCGTVSSWPPLSLPRGARAWGRAELGPSPRGASIKWKVSLLDCALPALVFVGMFTLAIS